MRRKIGEIFFGVLTVALVVVVVVYFGIGISVKSNIKHCQALYHGSICSVVKPAPNIIQSYQPCCGLALLFRFL